MIIAILLIFVMVIPLQACAKDNTPITGDVAAPHNTVKIKLKTKRTNKINVKLTWNKAKGATKYVVYRKISGHKYKKIKTTHNTHYIDKRVFKHQHAYKVRACFKGAPDVYSNVRTVKKAVVRTFKVKAYAYSCGSVCANGQRCQVGRIATDPSVIRTGTWLYVNGYGLCKACDTGGDIHGRTVDLYMNSESACNRWGVRYPKVYILK